MSAPTSASPLTHTLMEKKAVAVSNDRNDPMTRPAVPKWAPEDTALLVPVRGPNRPIGARMTAPTTTPSSVASTASRSDSPKAIGSVPRMTVAKVFAPPNWIRNRSNGPEVRSSCGMVSTLYCSTSVARGGRRTADGDGDRSFVMGRPPQQVVRR